MHYRLYFLQCDWRRDVSLQKVINVNEARGISRMSPDPLSLVGSGDGTKSRTGRPVKKKRKEKKKSHMINQTLRELDLIYQLILTINCQKLPPGNSY